MKNLVGDRPGPARGNHVGGLKENTFDTPGIGVVHHELVDEMAAFDSLSYVARQALNYAPTNFSAIQGIRKLQPFKVDPRHEGGGDMLARTIDQISRKHFGVSLAWLKRHDAILPEMNPLLRRNRLARGLPIRSSGAPLRR